MHLDGKMYQDSPKMYELLLTSVFMLSTRFPNDYASQSDLNLSSCVVSSDDMEKKFKTFDPNKGPGPD